MRHSGSHTALADAVARFQAEMQRLAFAAVRAVIAQELARRRANPERARPRKGPPAQRRARQLELGLTHVPPRQLELPLARDAARQPASPGTTRSEPERDAPSAGEVAAAAAPATETPQPGAPPGGRGRPRWTRETITHELATWLLSGTALDAQFMARHGPRGLVAAARRVFGRFDAALNVAALHNARLYPDGPPARGASATRPATVAAAPHPTK
jgi:hypothetical protein